MVASSLRVGVSPRIPCSTENISRLVNGRRLHTSATWSRPSAMRMGVILLCGSVVAHSRIGASLWSIARQSCSNATRMGSCARDRSDRCSTYGRSRAAESRNSLSCCAAESAPGAPGMRAAWTSAENRSTVGERSPSAVASCETMLANGPSAEASAAQQLPCTNRPSPSCTSRRSSESSRDLPMPSGALTMTVRKSRALLVTPELAATSSPVITGPSSRLAASSSSTRGGPSLAVVAVGTLTGVPGELAAWTTAAAPLAEAAPLVELVGPARPMISSALSSKSSR